MKDHAAKLISSSLLIVVIFHSARFWIRQIGTFNSLNIPVSTFAPSVGKELVIGPLIEIVKDIQNIGPMKAWLLGVICTLFVIWSAIKFFQSEIEKKFKNIAAHVEDIRFSMKAFVFLTTPVFLLPKLAGVPNANLTGAVCLVALHYLVLLKKKPLAIVAIMVSLITGYFSFKSYYSQGIEMTETCRLTTTLVLSEDGKRFHRGCWISSSDAYVIMRKMVANSFTTIAVPRDQIKLMSFGVAEGAP